MLVRLYVVIDQEDEALEQEVKKKLNEICPSMSFSPSRPQASLANCLEFNGSASIEDIDALRSALNNDWTQGQGEVEAYGFNTKMFHPHVYYLLLQW